jgi:hypothetical protein
MSLKSTTEKIDGIITAATLLFLVCAWGAFGFPRVIEIVVAGGVISAGIGVFYWTKYRRQRRCD